MGRLLELPEPIYDALVEAARASGVAPADWIATKLPAKTGAPSGEVPRAVRDRLWQHVVSSECPSGIDNEGIDADLLREYLDPHEDGTQNGSKE
jgi:hypothetical protein